MQWCSNQGPHRKARSKRWWKSSRVSILTWVWWRPSSTLGTRLSSSIWEVCCIHRLLAKARTKQEQPWSHCMWNSRPSVAISAQDPLSITSTACFARTYFKALQILNNPAISLSVRTVLETVGTSAKTTCFTSVPAAEVNALPHRYVPRKIEYWRPPSLSWIRRSIGTIGEARDLMSAPQLCSMTKFASHTRCSFTRPRTQPSYSCTENRSSMSR